MTNMDKIRWMHFDKEDQGGEEWMGGDASRDASRQLKRACTVCRVSGLGIRSNTVPAPVAARRLWWDYWGSDTGKELDDPTPSVCAHIHPTRSTAYRRSPAGHYHGA
jgi:hypothetical protein